MDVRWVVITQDDTNPELFFAVPADGHPLVGMTDVIRNSYTRLTLRCGFGLWIHTDELTKERRFGKVGNMDVDLARRKMREITGGGLTGTAAQEESEYNPDYTEWLEKVNAVADATADILRRK